MRQVSNQWLRNVLLVLCHRRTVTRNEIIAETHLNPASLSHTIQYLTRHGIILKVGDLGSGVGRRREVYNLNPEAASFVGIDLEGHRIRFALLNLAGDIRGHWEEDLEYGEPLELEKIFHGINRLLERLEARQRKRVLAAGISYPGTLDAEGRLTAVNLGLHKYPFVNELCEKAKQMLTPELAIFLEPDRHCAVWAEQWLGRARGRHNGVVLFSERGIGIGIFLNGRPLEGWHNMAGEIGHFTVDSGSAVRCQCGKHGCLETVASSANIIRQYLEATGKRAKRVGALRVTDVFERARDGDTTARKVVERATKAVALALSHVILLVNPQVVILGGDLAAADDLLLPLIRDEVARNVLPDLMEGLEIVASGLGPHSRLLGAGALALRKSLADPVLLKKTCSPVLPTA